MPAVRSDDSQSTVGQSAYLMLRYGGEWGDIYRLVPGQVTTVGRAPTNRIVLRDEVCSRNHAEIFQSGLRWILRDLNSRNGTRVNGEAVTEDWILKSGQIIQIGTSELGFTYNLADPFPQLGEDGALEGDTATDLDVRSGEPQPSHEIVHRARESRFRDANQAAELRDRTSQQLAGLYRLALEMGAAPDAKQLAEIVLDGLLTMTAADIGAVLLLPQATEDTPPPSQLAVVAYKSLNELPYQRVSESLSRLTLQDREAILAHDITTDDRLTSRDSMGEISVQSLICAPVRIGTQVHGLIHLYSTNLDNPLAPDDLEFALAVADQFALALDHLKRQQKLAEGLARIETENQSLRQQLEIDSELIGDSPSIQQLKAKIARVAPTGATVLIRGESGVGKELVARAIHFQSGRRSGPFVCMNCAALSETLLESELFGHERGSFTGATGRKIGKYEQAHKGTLFLDEVGEMSLSIQAKFLRVLEGHPFERVGGGTPVKVDVRVVAATNRNLERAVEEGGFRRDLYFRLHVVELSVDPLRERRADIPKLAHYFLERFARKSGRRVSGFTPRALETLMSYDWPGNVRELQHAVERAVILCSGEVVSEADIQLSSLGIPSEPAVSSSNGSEGYRALSLELLEQEHILSTLQWTNWNKSQAAQILGIERSTLDRKLKRYEVERPSEP